MTQDGQKVLAPRDMRGVIGVTVESPVDRVQAGHWQLFELLQATPLVLVDAPLSSGPGSRFDFTRFGGELAAYQARGFRVAAGIPSHLSWVQRKPMVDEFGAACSDRQNLFDPEFRAEWRRLHAEFCEAFGQDPAVGRVYLAPPSYFGEIEHFLGMDWSDLKFYCYDAGAKGQFARWLEQRYGDARATAAAWGVAPFGSWADLPMPKPRRDSAEPHVDPGWLDLMEWRSDYLTSTVSEEASFLQLHCSGQVALLFAHGDSSAMHGTDIAAIVAACARPSSVTLHLTNAHSLSDIKYAASVARHHHVRDLVIENDGNRFGRTELAKICLNYLLSGASSLNYSSFSHLLDATGQATESGRALLDAAAIMKRYDPETPRKPIAFLHSVTSRNVRAPHYMNRDVSRVYDCALSNGPQPLEGVFDWGRWLDYPDVTGERLLAGGDLEGRRMLIVPNSGLVLLPESVHQALFEWVNRGGTLVAFGGGEAIASRAEAKRDTAGGRVRHLGWKLPGVTLTSGPLSLSAEAKPVLGDGLPAETAGACPVWEGQLPDGWSSMLSDAAGRSALAMRRVGAGRVLLFPQVVPNRLGSGVHSFYAVTVPLLLRAAAERCGCVFAFELSDAGSPSRRLVAPLSLGYVGRDRRTGKHLFVGGAYDESTSHVRLVPGGRLAGAAELLLIDCGGVQARSADPGRSVRVQRSRPSQYAMYQDPTNQELNRQALIPCTTVEFELPGAVELQLGL